MTTHHDHGGDHGGRHDHGGHHHGHHHDHAGAMGRAFAIGVVLNLAYVAAEVAFGLAAGSLALLADAVHNFGDVLGLAMAWLATALARRAPSARYTYGLRGSSILASLANAALLLLVTGGIAWDAVQRLETPRPATGLTILLVALAGVAVNGFCALLFAAGRKGDLNVRAAFSHLAADALVALGVVVAGAVILATGWTWVDPVASLAVSAIIVLATWSLMRESLDLALQAVPAGVDRAGILDYLTALPGVSEVHDLHIWGMSTTETALTAHLVRPGAGLDDALLHEVCANLRVRFAIHHATFQVETGSNTHPCELAHEGVV
jgi:cobalt-zinc-cadmium efflux system protein